MRNITMIIPVSAGTVPEQAAAIYTRVFPSLVSCLPGLQRSKQEPLRLEDGGTFLATCVLWFRTEQDQLFALTSREWVELIDETADIFNWESSTCI